MPPPIKPILDHLWALAKFCRRSHSASYRTLSAWGGRELLSNEFLFHTQQVGWRLDVLHCHILAHEDRGMMATVHVSLLKDTPAPAPYKHH